MKKSQRSHTHANNKSRDGDFYEIPRCFLSFDLLYDTSTTQTDRKHLPTQSFLELYVLPAAHLSTKTWRL
jgi:hypothetical protein